MKYIHDTALENANGGLLVYSGGTVYFDALGAHLKTGDVLVQKDSAPDVLILIGTLDTTMTGGEVLYGKF